jgi:regulator of protease activity HflC (stomatin/prohibitin superfamily)
MTDDAATIKEATGSNWLGQLGKVFYIFVVLFGAFFLYKGLYQPDDPGNHLWWTAGTFWLFLGFLAFVLLVLPPELRRFGLIVWLNFLLTVILAAFIQVQLTSNLRLVQAIQNSSPLTFLFGGFIEAAIWSIVLGLTGALLVTGLPLLVVAFVASNPVLALHELEGVSRRDAVGYVIALILGVNQPFMVVENGQALITKDAGKLAIIGGPGKLIVKQGNVVVLERGGKIIRIVNAGVHKLKQLEMIRNIYKLGPHTSSGVIEHVLTRDRIPLKITLSMKVRLEPADEADKRPESRIPPHGEALTKKLDDGLNQVYEGTVLKAALMSQATSWAKREVKSCDDQQPCQDVEETTWQTVGGSLPEAELRDHIMCHRFDELFELVDSAPGEEPTIRVDKRKIYQIEQAILEKTKVTKIDVLGVLVRMVDIGKIELPEGAEQLLLNRWGAPLAQQIQLIEAEAKAQGDLQAKLLGAQGELEATRLEAQGDLEIADLKAQAVLINARAEAQKRIMEGRSEAEARAAFFQSIVEALQVDGRPMDPQLTGAILQRLAGTFASVSDVETYMRVQSRLDRQLMGRGNGDEARE